VKAGGSRPNIRDTPDFSGFSDDPGFRSLVGLNYQRE
jgi:hypothetical protein